MEPCVRIYRFEDAPEEWQALSCHGGDEDFVIHLPQGWKDGYKLLGFDAEDAAERGKWYHDDRWKHYHANKLTDGSIVIITAHA